MNTNTRNSRAALMVFASMAISNMTSIRERGNDRWLHNSPEPRKTNPWDGVNLTKSERKGKTYEEIQAMRRERWEAQRSKD